MATLPAVPGLLKHHVYHPDPRTGAKSALVTTFWTWRNDGFPATPARITAEKAYLDSWVKGATYRTVIPGNFVTADWIKTWDMGTVPPVRATPLRVWPTVLGNNGNGPAPPQLAVLVALRTQPVGSAIVNRLNGRIYHSRPPNFFNGMNWDTAGVRTPVLNAYNQVLAQFKPANANMGQWVVPCFWEGGVLRPGGPLLPAVDHLIVQGEPVVRRTRQRHYGSYGRGA